MKQQTKLMLGDNMESLKKLPDNSIDSIVTDPPYGLSFMGKKWDYDVPTVEFWKEVYRVLKPGGHILSFGGTRTYHRMVVNIEDAGFEIRDQVMWLYGSGFPKSHNIGKAVDKFGGNNLLSTEIGSKLKEARTSRGLTLKQADELFCGGTSNYNWLEGRSDGQRIPNQELFDKIVSEWPELKDLRDKVVASERELLGVEITNKTVMKNIGEANVSGEYERTKGQSKYEGWGTALKPANEPICVARKPLSEKTIADNVIKWGTGGINIDGCRVGTDGGTKRDGQANKVTSTNPDLKPSGSLNRTGHSVVELDEGRFPANIILECICDKVIEGKKGEVIKSNRRFEILQNKSDGKVERTENYGDEGDIHTNPNCPCYLLDEQSGISKPKKERTGRKGGTNESDFSKAISADPDFIGHWPGDNGGGASRYFFNVKNYGGTEDFFIYKENNIIIWNIKSLDTQEYNTEESIEASDALKQARESICQKPELYGNNTMVKYLTNTISITKMKTHSIMNLVILNAYTKMNIGHFTLMIDEKQSQLLTEESILNVQIVSNQNALVSSIKTNQEVLVPIVSYVLEENLVSGETTIESTITNTTENIGSNRFLYVAKVSKKERNLGLDGFEDKIIEGRDEGQDERSVAYKKRPIPTKNTHPTLKPINLMTYLCRLITPEGGIVLDPFMGSGSTGISARLEGFRFVGMEMDKDYFKIAEARIEAYEEYRKLLK